MKNTEKIIQEHLEKAAKAVENIMLCEQDLDTIFFSKKSMSIIPPPVEFFEPQNNKPDDPIIISYPDNYSKLIGQAIKHKREQSGFTQNELAEITGIKRPNIARLEKGTTYPNISTLIKISQALNFTLSDILKF